jgi:hypothetical protein
MIQMDRPDYFEQDSAHEVARLVKSAAQYVLAFAAHRHARLRLWTEWSDELWLVSHAALELLFLARRSASLGDSLCALQRAPLAPPWRLAVFVLLRTVAPYVDARLAPLDDAEAARSATAIDAMLSPRRRRLALALLLLRQRVLPVLRRVLALVSLLLRVSYAFDERQRAFSLADVLSGTAATRLSFAAASAIEAQRAAARTARLASVSVRAPLSSAAALAVQGGLDLFDSAAAVIGPLVTAYRFVEWWYANESALLAGSVFVPPAPGVSAALENADTAALLKERQLCPLCRRERRNAAVALTSGVVYCYRCALTCAKEHGECAVTRRPLKATQIARLFRDGDEARGGSAAQNE